MVKCLIEHLNFSTGPNMWYTYGGGQSATSDSKCLELKKKDITATKSTTVRQAKNKMFQFTTKTA